MSDVLVGIEGEGVVFDTESLVRDVLERWPHSTFVPAEPSMAPHSLGQLTIDELHGGIVMIEVLASRGGLGVEGDDAPVAQFLEWLANWHHLPAAAIAWPALAPEPLPLRPGLTAQQVLDAEA